MSALSPPLPRPRIHSVSTGIRPPLSISTLARSPAISFFARELGDASSSPQSSSQASSAAYSSASLPSPSPTLNLPPLPLPKSRAEITRTRYKTMFPALVSRTVDLWRAASSVNGKHATSLFSSPGSSPRSSTETEYILPLSASPRKASFDATELEVPSRPGVLDRPTRLPSVHASLLLVVILFPISSAVVFFAVSSLPITFAWPRTLSDLSQVGRDLSAYSQSGLSPTIHIVGVLAVSAVWKHAWSIPGSVLWNVLAGALFHPLFAILLMIITTSIGSVLATLLATPLAPVLTRAFPRPVELTRAALEGSSITTSNSVYSGESKTFSVTTTSTTTSSPAWVRLSILRLIGIVPWSALNIACGLTGVAIRDCFSGAFIGCLPWTAVTCQIGDVLQAVNTARTASETGAEGGISNTATVASILAQPSMIFELVFLTVLSLAPILFRDRLRRLLPSSSEETADAVEMDESGEKEILDECSQHSDQLNVPLSDEEEEDLNPDDRGRRGRHLHRQRWTWQRLSMSVPRWSALNSPLRQSLPKVKDDAHR